MIRYCLLFLGLSLTCFLSAASSVLAQTPRRFYDWSSTLETRQPPVLGLTVYAQESTGAAATASPTPSKQYEQLNDYLLGGNLTPDSGFYFAKTFQENIRLTFTFDDKKREELRLKLAGERLDEMQQMATANKPKALAASSENYDRTLTTAAQNIAQLKSKKVNVADLAKKIETETAKHNLVLEEVSAQVPEQAREAIERAIEANWGGIDRAADLIGRPAVPADMIDRLQALKAQGLLTEEEVNKLINVKSRSEAREEIQKYVREGIVPEADFIRLNENVKELYRDDFYKLHEMKRFYELKRLEGEKPDEATMKRIQEFAKTYQPGAVVPADIRKYWVPVVRLEEIQNTLRLDLIDENLLKSNQEDYKKFNEIVERFKPRPEDIAFMKSYLEKNNGSVDNLPPEYQRMYNLAHKYGAQCGAGSHWEILPQTGGMCVPNDFKGDSARLTELPRIEDFAKGKACSGPISAAKGPAGVCSAYPADCIPPGWTKAASCVETPEGEAVGLSCPSNSHWVPIPYMPDGGYCIPNYTPVDQRTASSGQGDYVCPTGYHRSYSGGPCLPDYNTVTSYILPPLSSTPGSYPSPLYPSATVCGPGTRWIPEPIHPKGGYCGFDSSGGFGDSGCPEGQYRGPGGYCTALQQSSEAWKCAQSGKYWDGHSCKDAPPADFGKTPGNGLPRPDMGNCSTPAECYDWCKANPGKCAGFNPSTSRPSDSIGPVPASCMLACPSGQYLDSQSCSCRSNNDYPTSCAYPSGGCGSDKYWDYSSCSCKISPGTGPKSYYNDPATACRNSGGTWTGSTCQMPTTTSSGGTSSTPPSGYGSCSLGQYWNGSACVSSSTSTTDPSTACRNAGGSWNGSSCQMPTSATSTSTFGKTAEQMCNETSGCSWNGSSCICTSQQTTTQSTTESQPTSQTTQTQESSSPPPSSSDPASACSSSGGSWDGSTCRMP